MADIPDLKSGGDIPRAGSNPAPGTLDIQRSHRYSSLVTLRVSPPDW